MRWPFGGKGHSSAPAENGSVSRSGGSGTPVIHSASERPSAVPTHLAVIMDGNGRWAKAHHFPRIEGHRAGAKTVRMVVEESRRLGVKYLTLFSFSTENWLRPRDEVSGLMRLFCQYVESERDLLMRHGIRLRAIGDRDKLPREVQESLERIERETSSLCDMQLILALSYGGRDELVRAARKICEDTLAGKLRPSDIDADAVRSRLYAPDVPDPDMLLRTSDEFRISNFLLWQLAYTEIVITKALWPALTVEEFRRCVDEFATRRRRFGLTDEQIVEQGGAAVGVISAAGPLAGEVA